MNLSEATNAATPLIQVQVAALSPAPDFELDNMETGTGARRARLTYNYDQSRPVEKGHGLTDRTLVVATVQLRYPLGQGIGQQLEAADILKRHFQGESFGGLTWLTGWVDRVGRDGDRYLVNVHLPFEVENIAP